MNDDREWDGVTDRRSVGDRREGNTAHVTVDGLSNGARMFMERALLAGENAVEEAKKTRKWIVGALLVVGAFLIAAGQFRGATNERIAVRPTESAVLEMFAERDSALISVIHEQQITLEVIGERQRETTRRLDLTEAEIERIRDRLNGSLERSTP